MEFPSLARDERAAYGRLERKRCQRSSLGKVVLGRQRTRLAPIFAQEDDRVQALLPLRHERMSVSPFTFFRGSAILMTADLAAGPTTKLNVQACGDAHAANFGMFASPERQLVFDLNDFDETYRGPFEWDLKRLGVSLLLAAEDAGLGLDAGNQIAATALRTYCERMREYAEMHTLEVWYARLDGQAIAEHLDEMRAAQMREEGRKAMSRSAIRALQKFVVYSDQGQARFREKRPRLQRVPEGEQAPQMFEDYLESLAPERADLVRRFRIRDLAFKAVGVGSVGTRCFVAVLDSGDPSDQLLLQMKEANRSVLAPHIAGPGPRNQGRRVVVGQKLMQAVGDVLLGWTRNQSTGRDYYVRQLWDMKGDLDLGVLDHHAMETHAMLCGWALARAHARTGDPVALAAYLGKRDKLGKAVLEYSNAYRDVVHRDHETYLEALEDRSDREYGGELPGWGD